MGETSDLQTFEFESLTIDEQGVIVERRPGRAQQLVERLSPDSALEMVVVPAGVFRMGSRPGNGEPDEQPQHSVWIRSFLLGKFPVTQEQWQAIMGGSPPFRYKGAKRPADRISWTAGREFCARLSRRTGRAYRLPGEAEWEYACRAGSSTAFSCGKTLTTGLANYVGTVPYLKEPPGLNRHETTTPGTFPPNAFGLQDMHGNLWEWCADAWHEDYRGAASDNTPYEGHTGDPRVLRGGSWHDPPSLCRSAVRLFHAPDEGEDIFGFRVALDSISFVRGQPELVKSRSLSGLFSRHRQRKRTLIAAIEK